MMRLRYVVVDELHTQRGIFGSHVAHVLRRLRRVCEHYGANPTFCFASATIGNPGALASELCGLPGRADRPRRLAAFRACARVLAAAAARRALRRARRRPTSRPPSCSRGSSAPVTRRSRSRAAGAAPSWSRSTRAARLEQVEPGLGARVAAYRAGYLASERRELELELTSGRLLGVAATNALELGIDVGGLDAVVLNGFPGTLASMWQQAGRAGRTDRRGRGGARRRRRPARPVVRRASVRAHRPRARTRGRQPAEPVRAARAGRVRGARAAALARRRPLVRRRPRRRRARARAGRPAHAARRAHVLVGPARAGGRRRAAQRLVGRVPARRRRGGAHDRHRRRRARVRRRASRRGLPAPGPAVPRRPARHAASTSRCSSRTTTTSTRCRAPRPTSRSSPTSSSAAVGESIVHLGAVEVRSHVIAYQRKQISTNRVIEVCDLDLPERALVHPRVLVHRARRGDGARRHRAGPAARHRARGRARPDRHAPAVHDLRPLGRRRRLDGACIRRPASRRSSSTTATPAARASPSSRSRRRHATCARRSTSSPRARATTAARRACSRRSAATGTSTSTRAARSRCSGSWRGRRCAG